MPPAIKPETPRLKFSIHIFKSSRGDAEKQYSRSTVGLNVGKLRQREGRCLLLPLIDAIIQDTRENVAKLVVGKDERFLATTDH